MSPIDYREHIQRALNYIEENLQNDINNAELARIAGYSEYHFLRVFKEAVHLTPGDYIRKRRLSEIVRQMAVDSRPISSIAFEYGFNSKENFVRAFKTEHHILPTDFKSAQNSLKLYDRMSFEAVPFRLEAKLMTFEHFRLVAYQSDEDFPPHFWNKYNSKQWSKKLSGGKTVEDFGVSLWNHALHKVTYYIGVRETDAGGDLTDTVTLDIAGGLYAVFDTPPATHFDFVNTIHRTWDYIIDVWLPENGYRRTGGFELESYVEESRKFSERIYIPITPIQTERTENS